jgi:hypothetical protein
VYSAVVKSEVMEGLACPRGTALSPPERKTPAASLPQVEGLASRFDSFFEKVSVGLSVVIRIILVTWIRIRICIRICIRIK